MDYNKQLALAFAPKPPALLSVLSSSYVITEIVRSPTKMGKMFHRLVLAMNICNIVVAATFFAGTWAIPKGTPYALGASGSRTTCTAQALLINFGLTVPTYYIALAIVSIMAIKHDFKEEKYKYIEPLIHATAFGWVIIMCTIGLTTNSFHPAGAICWINSYPPGCESTSAYKCKHYVPSYYRAMAAGWTIACFIIGPLLMVRVYFTLRERGNKMRQSATNEGQEVMAKFHEQRSKIVAMQGSLYVLALILTYIFSMISRMIEWKTGSIHFETLILGIICNALQGFWNMIVYVLLRNSAKTAFPISSDQVTVLRRIVSTPRTQSIISDSESYDGHSPPSNGGREIVERFEFSIFDGMNPHERWNEFMVENTGDRKSVV